MFSVAEVTAQLPRDPQTMRFHYALRHGAMKVGLYAPSEQDSQGPHKQDELYVVIAGTGLFLKNGSARPFRPGDVIFVEAGAEHRFEDFSADFAAWTIFWGPDGGEAA